MSTSLILQIEQALITATITLSSLTTGSGRVSTLINLSTIQTPRIKVGAKIKSGAAAPTAGATYDLYLAKANDATGSIIISDGVSITDAAATALNSEYIGSLILSATANNSFQGWFTFENPGNYVSILVVNSSGQTTSTTAGDHVIEIFPLVPQAQ